MNLTHYLTNNQIKPNLTETELKELKILLEQHKETFISIELKNNKLVIKTNDKEEEKEINNQELQLIQSYCQK